MTYFRAVYPALSSAQLRFTVLFGMGRRGSTALCSSGILLPGSAEAGISPGSCARRILEEVLGSTIATKAYEVSSSRKLKAIGSSRTGN